MAALDTSTVFQATPVNVAAADGCRVEWTDGTYGTRRGRIRVEMTVGHLGDTYRRFFLMRRTHGEQISPWVSDDTTATFRQISKPRKDTTT